VNYFVHLSAAERYARDRPYFHPLVIKRMKAFLELSKPVPLALDVGCGTGMSSVALTEIAETVIAADPSAAMLAQAPVHPHIRYLEALAEHLPLENASVNLVSVTLAFHWFDRARFLAETRRVLKEDGTLVITSYGLRSWLSKNEKIVQWFKEQWAKFPSPPRNNDPFTDDAARENGFQFIGREEFSHEIRYTPEELARNLVTHSNVIAAIEQGTESVDDILAWITESLRPAFAAEAENLVHAGEIWYLRPVPPP
jgi:ubiquinone/menaquinone biosynthesis C-methylase UbiE